MSNRQENKLVEKPKQNKKLLIGDKKIQPSLQILND